MPSELTLGRFDMSFLKWFVLPPHYQILCSIDAGTGALKTVLMSVKFVY